MNSTRSLKSNPGSTGRMSPNLGAMKFDGSSNRPSSPLTNVNRLSHFRKPNNDEQFSISPVKGFSEDDRRYHKTVFDRCVDSPNGHLITNREKFGQALNYVGYDLPKSKLDELWSNYGREITMRDFQRILNEEKPIDQRSIEEAFEVLYNKDRKTDWNAVDYQRFRTDMLERGDRFTEEEFEKLRRLLGTEHAKIDVRKLTRSVEENKAKCREKIITEKQEQRKEELERPAARVNSPKSRNSNENVHIIIDSESKKPVIPEKTRSLRMKGAFFCEYYDSPADALYFSIGYSFELKRSTPIWFTIEPTLSYYHQNQGFKNLDIRLFLFETIPHSTERRLLHISSQRSGSKAYLHLDELRKGSYEILPVTFGAVLRARTREVSERQPTKTLRETKKGNQFAMSNDYRQALEFVFDVFDLDENKQLDRQEYNLWTIRTTGEEITDEDWLSIREHSHLDKDENISKEKFLKLNEFEVQDKDTTEQDLWTGLKSLGFNYALELDMMCPFNLIVHMNESNVHLKPTSYVELTEIKKILVKFLKNKGERIRVNNQSIHCFNYQDESGSILFAENRSASNVRLSIQVNRSMNAALDLPTDSRKPPVINIRHDSTQILWFAHRLDSQRAMELDANIEAL